MRNICKKTKSVKTPTTQNTWKKLKNWIEGAAFEATGRKNANAQNTAKSYLRQLQLLATETLYQPTTITHQEHG